MKTGWRKAFRSTIPKEREHESPTHKNQDQAQVPNYENPNPSPKSSTKLSSIFSSISNLSTPILHVQTFADNQPSSSTTSSNCSSPTKLQRKLGSNHYSSPRSPFTILKNTLRFSKNNGCGICMHSVKKGQGKAIYTAECSHTFHFPCIVTHVRKHQGNLICPVCYVSWKDVPFFSFHNNVSSSSQSDEIIVDKKTIITTTTTTMTAPATPTGAASTRIQCEEKRVTKKAVERPYKDDEPLSSPRLKFNSIPEAEESEDVEEFQGFFVTPRPSIDPRNSVDKNAPRQVDVKLLPEAAVVSGSRSHETYAVALRVKAPPAVDGAFPSSIHRSPMDIVTVLDVSGSMTGPKLQMLKRAMRLVISALSSADRLSIIAFSLAPQRLMPLRRMTSQGQKSARKIVDHLACCQGTSVEEALKKAAKVLEDRREKNPVCSIILLSDGQDNHTILNQRCKNSNVGSTRFAHIEVLINPSGFEVRTHEPDQDAFAKCIGGLLSVVVQDLRIQLGFSSGSAPAEIMAVYSCNGKPGLMSSDSARLGDLYAEEERNLLTQLKVPISAIGSHHVMSIRCSYKDPVTQEVMYGSERALLVPRPHAVPFTDPKIERLRNIFIYTRAVAESRRLVEHYDFSSALRLLSSAHASVLQSSAHGSALTEQYARGLEGELASVRWKRQYHMQKEQEANSIQHVLNDYSDTLTPNSAWRAAEQLAKVAKMKMSLNRSLSDLHGFENARF